MAFWRECTFDSLPTGYANNFSFSDDGLYFAVAQDGAPSVLIYKRSGDSFSIMPPISGLPATSRGCAFSASGNYLVVTHADALPYISIFKRNGDSFTKLDDPTGAPNGQPRLGGGCAFSGDGIYLAVATDWPGLFVYKRSGETFAQIANLTMDSYGQGDCSFSLDGTYLAVTTSKGAAAYKRSGDSFSRLPTPAQVNDLYSWAVDMPAGAEMLATGVWVGTTTAETRLYLRSGDSFLHSKTLERASGRLSFSGDGRYFARNILNNTTYGVRGLEIHNREGTNISTESFGIEQLGLSAISNCKFSPDGAVLAVGLPASPYIKGFATDADILPSKPSGLSPNDAYVYANSDVEFSWTHNIASHTPQGKADVQYKTPGGEWQPLITVEGPGQSVTVPADTLTPGAYQWRVRTYNQDGYMGEWSDPAAFMAVGTPAAPLIMDVANTSRPIVLWSAAGQQGYHMQITQGDAVAWDSLETAGAAQTRKVPTYLANGDYKARVRIVNASMLWSNWAEQDFTIDVTGPAKPTITAQAATAAALLVFSALDAAKIYLLRGGVPIANVTGKTEYTDYAALGSTVYVLRAVDASDNYTDSDPVGVTVAVPCVMMAAVDALTEIVQMHMKKNDQPGVSRQKDVMGSAHYYAGRTRPVYRFSGFVGEQYSPAFYYTTSTDFARLEALIDKRLTILYRDNLGNKYYGVITGITHTQENYMYEFALAIMRVDYIEQIDYEV